jgi:NADH dehydrogenase
VEVRFGAAVEDYDGVALRLNGGESIPARTLIWAAGAEAAPLAARLGLPTGVQGRIRVTPALQVAGHPEILVAGDVALVEDGGAPLPMLAQPAMQMGVRAARNIAALLAGRPLEPFRFRDPGTLATIGRNAAVAWIGGFGFTGFVAWVVWLVVHLVQLIGFRNKLVVLINWAWDYFAYERASRLVGPPAPGTPA